jgi:hypothetical protein
LLAIGECLLKAVDVVGRPEAALAKDGLAEAFRQAGLQGMDALQQPGVVRAGVEQVGEQGGDADGAVAGGRFCRDGGRREDGCVEVWVAVDEASVHSGCPCDRGHRDRCPCCGLRGDRVVDLQAAPCGVTPPGTDQWKLGLHRALEDNPRRLQGRILKVLDGAPAPAGLYLPTACPNLSAGGADMIRAWLDTHPDARMVVIDVFAKVRGQAAGSNAYSDDYRAAGLAKAIADEYGIAVVLVHHTRKMAADDFLEELSGTNGIAGAADTIHVLSRSRHEADAVLKTTGRDVEEAERALSFDPATGTWSLLEGSAVEHTVHSTSATILRYVRGHQGATPREIADATALAYDNTKRTCARMGQRGQLISVGDGGYAAPPEPGIGDLP